MTTTKLTLALGGAALLAAASPAMAADVRAQLTPDLIYEHCVAAGIGSETEGTFMLPTGKRITGSVLCTAEDMAVANAQPARRGDDDDEHESRGRARGGDDHDDDEDSEGEGRLPFGLSFGA